MTKKIFSKFTLLLAFVKKNWFVVVVFMSIFTKKKLYEIVQIPHDRVNVVHKNGNVIITSALTLNSIVTSWMIVQMEAMNIPAVFQVKFSYSFCIYWKKKWKKNFRVAKNRAVFGKVFHYVHKCLWFYLCIFLNILCVALNPFYNAHHAQIHNYHCVTETLISTKQNLFTVFKLPLHSIINCFIVITATTICRDDEISCDGKCHPPHIRCNGYPECADGIDEENCPNSVSTTQSPLTVVFSSIF